eukprot:3478567-Rhodomonas_salina.1
MCGTEPAYTRYSETVCAVLRDSMCGTGQYVRYWTVCAVLRDSMCGTERAYGGTRERMLEYMPEGGGGAGSVNMGYGPTVCSYDHRAVLA